ncbi:MAG: polysaccharide biosynthesis/export family protein, partial [Nitrospira sp.]|nr:polysaccharide biosynthesis/export family protein [Nitrospira sp.]
MQTRIFLWVTMLAVAPVLAQAQTMLGTMGLGQTGTGSLAQAAPMPHSPPANTPKSGRGGLVPPANSSSASAPETPQAVPEIRPDVVEEMDAGKSLVFGAQLFTGAFARQGPTLFNPDYLIAIGDSIRVTVWGSVAFDGMLVVDPQGNVLLSNVGPVKVAGVRNQDLQTTIEKAIRRIYKTNVYSYASLAEAQPVRIFVGGFVRRPGLYNGTSMDSLLHYLDQAGGIDVERGSFLNVQVKRGEAARAQVNLYEFLLEGRIPQIQLADGDVIFVSPRQHIVSVGGLAENAKRFEFAGPELNLGELVKMAKPLPQATHIRITRNTGVIKNIEYYPMEAVKNLTIITGDEVEFTADKRPGTITVRVQGEHLG